MNLKRRGYRTNEQKLKGQQKWVWFYFFKIMRRVVLRRLMNVNSLKMEFF